jgi:2-oxoglutarate dehydrogenase E2 component (dihydrolipoamide succinyltransferase)
MATDILMPKMGESVQEGTILRWLKQPGEKVERDEIIAEISTDKVDTEIPSPAAGTLLEIVAQENETVEVGRVIARLGAEGEAPAGDGAPAAAPPAAAPPAAEATPPSAPAEPQPGELQVESGGAPAPESAPARGNDAASAPAAPPAAPAAQPGSGQRTPIMMPKMGESVQEGTILRWVKKAGEAVERDEIIAEISTDKVDTEIPSPAAGTLAEIVAQEGETIEVGKVIAYLSSGADAGSAVTVPGAEPGSPAPQPAAPAPAPAAAPAAGSNGQNGNAPTPAPQQQPVASTEPAGPIPRMSGGRFYSPLVRTIAETEKISVGELDAIQGTGLEGRVTKNDLLGYLKTRGTAPAAAPAQAQPAQTQPAQQQPQVQGAPAVKAVSAAPREHGPDVDVVPMDRMRQLIAEHMVRSKATSPHVTEVGEADVTGLVRLREGKKEEFKKQQGINLTYTPFLVAAVAAALRENPWVNASVEGTNVLVKKRVNVGVATALPDGNLIVPVVKDADRMNITGIAHAVSDLAARARNKSLKPDEIAGGTFTLTNYGVFGLLHGAPIINQPQVAILGSGAIQKRPVVREIDGEDVILIKSMIYLSLSHDHRIVDGLLGGKFLADVIRHLEAFGVDSTL